MKKILEVCSGTYQDCLNAFKGGAKRVELNSALALGGLTPSLSTLIQVKKDTDLEVVCMVRPRAGGFHYDEMDFNVMMSDAKLFLENGADGIAFGFLNEDKTIQIEKTRSMVRLIHSYHKTAVFHRAFDVTENPFESIEQLIQCGIDRVLTSGLKAKAIDGLGLIKELQNKYGNQIEILAGSGVNESNVKELFETGIYQVHSSCKSYTIDPTTKNEYVSYEFLSSPYESFFDVVDEEKVRKLLNVIEEKKI